MKNENKQETTLPELVLECSGDIVNKQPVEILQENGTLLYGSFIEALFFFYNYVEKSTYWMYYLKKKVLSELDEIFPYFCNTKHDSFATIKSVKKMQYTCMEYKPMYDIDKTNIVLISEELIAEFLKNLNNPTFTIEKPLDQHFTIGDISSKIKINCLKIDLFIERNYDAKELTEQGEIYDSENPKCEICNNRFERSVFKMKMISYKNSEGSIDIEEVLICPKCMKSPDTKIVNYCYQCEEYLPISEFSDEAEYFCKKCAAKNNIDE